MKSDAPWWLIAISMLWLPFALLGKAIAAMFRTPPRPPTITDEDIDEKVN